MTHRYITVQGLLYTVSSNRCVKMFPPKTRANVGMVQCASEGHGKPTGRKTVRTRRRAGPCKEGGQPVHTKPMQVINIR